MSTYDIAEAQARLPDLVERSLGGEEVVITRDGAPAARLAPSLALKRVTEEGLARLAEGRASRPAMTESAGDWVSRDEDGDFDEWVHHEANLVHVHDDDARSASILARRWDLALRAPDALHAATCIRLGATLLALDVRQARDASTLGITAAP